MNKKELRAAMRQARMQADPKEAEQCARLLAELPEFQQAERIFCYASYGTELPTAPIAALGKPMAYPKVLDRERMVFYQTNDLCPGFRGIPEPQGGEVVIPTARDLMLLPGLAFSCRGDRLGYGGGYYDRYLAALPQKPLLCGLGYALQVVEELPREPHDMRLDLLITPNGICRY